MMMFNPPHPGEIIREQCLEPLNLSVTEAAKGLGVSRKTISELLNGHSGVSSEMAVRLSKAFGSSPEAGLRLQMQFDLAKVTERADSIHVTRFSGPAPA